MNSSGNAVVGGGSLPLSHTSPSEVLPPPDCQYILGRDGGGRYSIKPNLVTGSLDNLTVTCCPLTLIVVGVNVSLRLTMAIDVLSALSVKLKTPKEAVEKK